MLRDFYRGGISAPLEGRVRPTLTPATPLPHRHLRRVLRKWRLRMLSIFSDSSGGVKRLLLVLLACKILQLRCCLI